MLAASALLLPLWWLMVLWWRAKVQLLASALLPPAAAAQKWAVAWLMEEALALWVWRMAAVLSFSIECLHFSPTERTFQRLTSHVVVFFSRDA